jgi:hypothetical protein
VPAPAAGGGWYPCCMCGQAAWLRCARSSPSTPLGDWLSEGGVWATPLGACLLAQHWGYGTLLRAWLGAQVRGKREVGQITGIEKGQRQGAGGWMCLLLTG